jgi:hypothetical protein
MTEELIEEVFARTYREETTGLERRLQFDPGLSVADVEGMLRTFYDFEGQDMLGRGLRGDAVLAATIEAYEDFAERLKQSS